MSHKTAATVAHTIGIDTGKNTLHLIGLDDKGAIVLREKIARGRIAARFANVPRCLIGIEAGMATHYVARELIALGHDVRQVPPAYAKPFRQHVCKQPIIFATRLPRPGGWRGRWRRCRAGLPLPAPAATLQELPDPIFAAIDMHRAAQAACDAVPRGLDIPDELGDRRTDAFHAVM